MEGLGRALSSSSLAPSSSARSDPDHPKRISYSEMALNKAHGGRLHSPEEPLFPGFTGAQPSSRLLSRSHHNLGQVPESPEHRVAVTAPAGGHYGSQSGLNRAQLLASHHQTPHSTLPTCRLIILAFIPPDRKSVV